MGKAKEFLKKHKYKLVTSVAVCGAVWVGYAIGKKSLTVDYHFRTSNRNLANFIRDVNTEDFFIVCDEPLKLSELGKLGERLIDANHPADYVVDHIMGFKK